MEEFSPQPVKGPDEEPVSQAPDFPEIPVAEELKTPSFWHRLTAFISENRWYVVAIIVGLLIIGVLAAFAFWPRDKERAEEAKVSITFDAPSTVSAGGEVIYKIKLLNQDPAKLVDMNLELVYDEGLTYVSSSPKPENISGSSFTVPDLDTGQNAVIIVKTLAQGNVNDDKKLVARLHYSFDNFSSGFTLEQSHQVRLVAADVVVDLSGPEMAANSDVVTYKVNYRNSSKKEIENGRIQVTYPEGFSYSASKPEPSLSKNIWNIGTLKPGDTGEIEFSGVFRTSNSGQSAEFVAEFLVLDSKGDFFTQSSSSFTTRIESRPLNIEQKLANSRSNGIVEPGETVTVELTFKNSTEIVNTGLQVIAEVDSSSVELNSIRSESGFVSDGTISWNGSGVKSLESLNPGSSGTLRYSFKVKDPATQTDQQNIEINLKAKIKSNENKVFIPTPDLKVKISSPVGIKTSAEHSGGALPPVVGVSSAFTVNIEMFNNSNAMRDGVLVGYIPTGVNLDTSTLTPAEKNFVSFDKSTGKVTWNYGQLVAHAGVTKLARKLSFVVTATPSTSQLGQNIVLFKSITMQAKDDFTGVGVDAKTGDLDTGAIGDNSSNGRVQN